MSKYLQIKTLFEAKEDKEKAVLMSKYMRNLFSFYGISTPDRKVIYKEFLKLEKQSKKIDWVFLDQCYEDNHREFQYLVCDYLFAMKSYITYSDFPKIEAYILKKSWWDTIDALDKVVGDVQIRDKRVKDLMQIWSKHDNIWIRRIAIDHQLSLKEKTDTKLLEDIITNCFGSDEFFINKAIGWALREYSKTNPQWVKTFISKHHGKMSKLSIKEASKYI